jgi:cupin fold WbuC family metalloprotein
MNLNLHEELIDPINRFINGGHAGTYVRPHRHRTDKWELLTALRGRFDVLTFTDDGEVTARLVVEPDVAPVVEIAGGSWHTVVFHAPAAVMLEVKPGLASVGAPQLPIKNCFQQWSFKSPDIRLFARRSPRGSTSSTMRTQSAKAESNTP